MHFLGLSSVPKANWFERTPTYEFIVHVGGAAKRLRPRVPAPPADSSDAVAQLEKFVPPEQLKTLQRLDERLSIRAATPGEYFRVDVWEERKAWLDFGDKGAARQLLGQCYVPLEKHYNRRPCTWPIVSRVDKTQQNICGINKPPADANQEKALFEVGFLTCKFGLATMPGTVRNLRIAEGTTTQSEVTLVWDPPESDGGTPLRGYRVEARELTGNLQAEMAGVLGGDETPRTASAPPSAEPSATIRNLHGNTAYMFCVWAVSEAGPGSGSEVEGHTGAVEPGLCGRPRLVVGSNTDDEAHYVEWDPPMETGGAPIVAYRVWLRPLFHNSAGKVFPAEAWIDLGFFEHRGAASDVQRSPLRTDALPACSGCLCSLAALNSSGHTGPSTQEEQFLIVQPPKPIRNDFSIVPGSAGVDREPRRAGSLPRSFDRHGPDAPNPEPGPDYDSAVAQKASNPDSRYPAVTLPNSYANDRSGTRHRVQLHSGPPSSATLHPSQHQEVSALAAQGAEYPEGSLVGTQVLDAGKKNSFALSAIPPAPSRTPSAQADASYLPGRPNLDALQYQAAVQEAAGMVTEKLDPTEIQAIIKQAEGLTTEKLDTAQYQAMAREAAGLTTEREVMMPRVWKSTAAVGNGNGYGQGASPSLGTTPVLASAY